MATVDASVSAAVSWRYERADSIGTARDAGSASETTTYTTGTGTDMANVLYRARITLTRSEWIYDIDLKLLTDVYGDTLSMTGLKALFFQNLGTAAGDNIRVGPQGATNGMDAGPWGTQPNAWNLLGPKAILVINSPIDAWTVSNTCKIVRVRHSGVTYPINVDFAILGTKAL